MIDQANQKRSNFLDLIEQNDLPLLADGAMGTMLHARGVGFNECFDALNLSKPDLVAEIHREYIQAGAQIIYTNTFGANRCKLGEHGLENKVKEINRAGVELARRVVMASFKEVLIAGDVGPLGVRLAPFGRVKPEQARSAFAEQITALADTGVDLIVIETFSDLFEIREAINASKNACNLPIVASVTFTRDDRTLLGDSPSRVAKFLSETGADVIGANCSGGPAQLWRILKQMQEAVPNARFLIKPNAGWPEQLGGRVMYSASPEYFGEYAQMFASKHVSMIGGCCGTTPEHITKMREALDAEPLEMNLTGMTMTHVHQEVLSVVPEQETELSQKLRAKKFVMAVELDPPRGLSAHKIIAGASLLKESGADVINVADSPLARMRMSPWAVCNLIQRKVGIETTLHFPTRGRNLLRVQGDLLAAHALNIRNIFVVMGDPTSIGDYPDAMDDYDLVPSGLIRLIKQHLNAGVDHAGSDIGQPTSFFVGCALNLISNDPKREMRVLQRKIKSGADFALTQPVYQPEKASAFLKQYEQQYGVLEIPILVGVLPLLNKRHAAFLHNELPGIIIPETLQRRIATAGDNAAEEGVKMAVELIDKIKPWANGVYLMPAFSRFDLAAEIIDSIRN